MSKENREDQKMEKNITAESEAMIFYGACKVHPLRQINTSVLWCL